VQVGVGAFVFDRQSQRVLMVQERNGPLRGKVRPKLLSRAAAGNVSAVSFRLWTTPALQRPSDEFQQEIAMNGRWQRTDAISCIYGRGCGRCRQGWRRSARTSETPPSARCLSCLSSIFNCQSLSSCLRHTLTPQSVFVNPQHDDVRCWTGACYALVLTCSLVNLSIDCQ